MSIYLRTHVESGPRFDVAETQTVAFKYGLACVTRRAAAAVYKMAI